MSKKAENRARGPLVVRHERPQNKTKISITRFNGQLSKYGKDSRRVVR